MEIWKRKVGFYCFAPLNAIAYRCALLLNFLVHSVRKEETKYWLSYFISWYFFVTHSQFNCNRFIDIMKTKNVRKKCDSHYMRLTSNVNRETERKNIKPINTHRKNTCLSQMKNVTLCHVIRLLSGTLTHSLPSLYAPVCWMQLNHVEMQSDIFFFIL